MEMAFYMRREMEHIEAMDLEPLLEGRIAWDKPPSWKGIKSTVLELEGEGVATVSGTGGDVNSDGAAEEEDEEEDEWREALALDGKK